jgi:hypothetical protein
LVATKSSLQGWIVPWMTRTQRFRTEAEAEGWANAERGKVVTNQWVTDPQQLRAHVAPG